MVNVDIPRSLAVEVPVIPYPLTGKGLGWGGYRESKGLTESLMTHIDWVVSFYG